AAWWAERDPGTAAHWQHAEADDAAWTTMALPGQWERKGMPDTDGVVWFRRTIDVPAAFADRELVLSLAAIDDQDTTWIDGVAVGAMTQWNQARRYRIPAGIVAAGIRTVAVRVLDTGGGGGFHGKA